MFHPLALVDGTVITADAPRDHFWHHGLWFAWKKLNGVNYWEENPETGKSTGLTSWKNVKVSPRPDCSASIELELAYHPVESAPVLEEKRTIEVSAPNARGEYHLDWEMTFIAGKEAVSLDRTPISGQPNGSPYGGYAGLSFRFTPEFRDWKAVTNDAQVLLAGPPPKAAKAQALEFSGRIGSEEVGVAMFDHPSNLNAPTPWYFIADPNEMTFAQAALIYYGPYTLKSGEQLDLRYRVLIHPGRWDVFRLNSELRQFARIGMVKITGRSSNSR